MINRQGRPKKVDFHTYMERMSRASSIWKRKVHWCLLSNRNSRLVVLVMWKRNEPKP